jgi:hypothetical protein
MLLMLLIGWTILLPAVVVAALYVGSGVLGRRRAEVDVYEDVLADGRFSEAALETEFYAVTPDQITGPAITRPAVPGPAAGASRSAEQSPAAPERRPVSAGY